jgi:hypothetical protein
MRSLSATFLNAFHLPSLGHDQLSGLLLFPFRNLPWRTASAVRRCVRHCVAPYPDDFHAPLTDLLMEVCARLEAKDCSMRSHYRTGLDTVGGVRLRA